MKNKRVLFALLTVMIAALASGCIINIDHERGNGHIEKKERKTSKFFEIIHCGFGDVNIYTGSEDYRVEVTTDSNIQDFVDVETEGEVLSIGMQSNSISYDPTELTIDVYVPELKAVTLKGSGNIKIYDGDTTDLEVNLIGSGNIDAHSHKVENVNVTLTGSGKVKLWVTKKISGKITGSGDILYKGNPDKINVNTTGSGKVREF